MKTRLITITVLTLAVAGLSAAAFAQQPGYGKQGQRGEGRQGMMQHVDTDGDGRITREEFKAVHERRFAMLDTDGDGVITLEEFGAPRMARFAERDADGNGVLEGDELQRHGDGPRRHRYHREP
ncbi:EF-hand domain-containing protein [Thioalkalivibrio sp. XN8]|uniref:EF-hand domain-containing protein n=1 Tax=Thioalkalivibrio sp. XN8 TaxID=2712863 RepID=UPI0013EA1076|nr:EF-hand domain-containing protein [Thioalkalivibrio sp. XN8]NGP52420.1 hypothetical protein [Thioalkalivibrio sp. XN8]